MFRHQMRFVSGQPCSSSSGKPPSPSRTYAISQPSRTLARSTAKSRCRASVSIVPHPMEVSELDYEAVRAGMEAAIPFNRHVGLSVTEVGEGRGVVALPAEDHLHNHVGSQHAGALFSAGEAASGAAFVGRSPSTSATSRHSRAARRSLT